MPMNNRGENIVDDEEIGIFSPLHAEGSELRAGVSEAWEAGRKRLKYLLCGLSDSTTLSEVGSAIITLIMAPGWLVPLYYDDFNATQSIWFADEHTVLFGAAHLLDDSTTSQVHSSSRF